MAKKFEMAKNKLHKGAEICFEECTYSLLNGQNSTVCGSTKMINTHSAIPSHIYENVSYHQTKIKGLYYAFLCFLRAVPSQFCCFNNMAHAVIDNKADAPWGPSILSTMQFHIPGSLTM